MDTTRLGYSYPWGKPEVADMIVPTLPARASILDVGAGNGVYREIFGHQFKWTAVEIWHETAEYLKALYDKVYEEDIRNFQFSKKYDLVILGDVLEHLTTKDAQKVIAKIMRNSNAILIAVPYELEQGSLYGNEAETHLQPDLTPEIFHIRYPEFKLIHCVTQRRVPIYGYYYWSKEKPE